MKALPRRVEARVRTALGDTRVVTVVGARQAGKSTLCRMVARDLPGTRERRLDLGTEAAAARVDPDGFGDRLTVAPVEALWRTPPPPTSGGAT